METLFFLVFGFPFIFSSSLIFWALDLCVFIFSSFKVGMRRNITFLVFIVAPCFCNMTWHVIRNIVRIFKFYIPITPSAFWSHPLAPFPSTTFQ